MFVSLLSVHSKNTLYTKTFFHPSCHSFIHSFILSFIHSFVRSFANSLIEPFILSFTHSFTLSFFLFLTFLRSLLVFFFFFSHIPLFFFILRVHGLYEPVNADIRVYYENHRTVISCCYPTNSRNSCGSRVLLTSLP